MASGYSHRLGDGRTLSRHCRRQLPADSQMPRPDWERMFRDGVWTMWWTGHVHGLWRERDDRLLTESLLLTSYDN